MFKQLLSRLRSFSAAFLGEFGRTYWAIFAVFIGALFISRGGREIFQQQASVLAWKLVLVGTGTFVAHIVRRQLFPYLDASALLAEKSQAGATAFLGICLIYAAIIMSITGGL
jgi:hypothetical protein